MKGKVQSTFASFNLLTLCVLHALNNLSVNNCSNNGNSKVIKCR